MAITYRIDSGERIVYITTTGESNFAEWRETMLTAISDPAYRQGFNFLSDRSGETDVPDPEFTRAASQFIQQHRDEFEGVKWAAVSSNAAVYGAQRLFIALSAATGITVQAFREYEPARQWLLGMNAEHHPPH
jgi:hypothetical protein